MLNSNVLQKDTKSDKRIERSITFFSDYKDLNLTQYLLLKKNKDYYLIKELQESSCNSFFYINFDFDLGVHLI